MRKTLLVTNDFPPRTGGIQSYLWNFVEQLPPDSVEVYCSTWRGDESRQFDEKQPYRIHRNPTGVLLPTYSVNRELSSLVRDREFEAVWFGAAAPLALMAQAVREAGAQRILASTHGHEVGWSMVPGMRQVLRKIGKTTDVVTFVSHYARSRIASALGPSAALEWLPSGVDSELFSPGDEARQSVRKQLGLGDLQPVALCLSRLVPRKGQDMLIKAWPRVLLNVPDAHLIIVGGGPYAKSLQSRIRRADLEHAITMTGSVPVEDLPRFHAAPDVFVMPCRTRGGGLDVEGLGIVFLEAAASGVPVIGGDSGGAPETIQEGNTGRVVSGTNVAQIADTVSELLGDTVLASAMGQAGRQWVANDWNWDNLGSRLRHLIGGNN